MRFKRQPQMDGGWVLNYDYLKHVQYVMNGGESGEIGIVDLETIEAVLLAVEKVEAQTQTGNT